jgi:CRISPR-associated endonuclease/helicase Cas3
MPEPGGGGRLTATDFTPFYRAVHHRDPFPWQQAVVSQVLHRDRWPDLVDVPTGLGKTSLLDVAVFVAAATAGRPGKQRLGRRRCFFVVDRRIVVDEATDHAHVLAAAVGRAERDRAPGVLGTVAAALRGYAPDAPGELLPVTRMRGGTTWAAAWLDRPDRPGIVLGTVDQVGSRLLFRGYGVSDRRRPLDAALVGTDALLLVDEAHLSTALLTTVRGAQERDRLGLPVPGLDVVRLSATGERIGETFELDLDAHRDNPEAWRRLTAGKQLSCMQTQVKDCPRVLADTVTDQLARHTGGGWAATALVVCNTVDRARAVHTLLTHRFTGRTARTEADYELLIGRSRPLDRPGMQDRLLTRFGSGRLPTDRAAVLVATQTVEVGINLDVDVLVTESASWDALVQRLGRLNRLGRYPDRFPGRVAAPAVVVHDEQPDGPVYGASRDRTWELLISLTAANDGPGLGVSPLQCRDLTRTVFAGAEVTRAPSGVPVLQVPTLDAWVNTAPVPLNDPPVHQFLHGFDTGSPAVLVAWRDGLVSTDPLDDPFDEDGAEHEATVAGALLTALPVRAAELVEVPFLAVRQWMAGQVAPPIGDLDSAPDAPVREKPDREPFRVLAWRADRRGVDPATGTSGSWRWITASQLRPADQVVAPTERGGLDRYGWHPSDAGRVTDVSEAATFLPVRFGAGRPTLWLDNGLAGRLGLVGHQRDAVTAAIARLRRGHDPDNPARDRVQHLLQALTDGLAGDPVNDDPTAPPGVYRQQVRDWLQTGPVLVEVTDPRAGILPDGHDPAVLAMLLTGGRLPGDTASDTAARSQVQDRVERDDEEVGASSIGPRRVTLDRHQAAARDRAGQIAAALRLPPDLAAVIQDAAGWHDLGKVEDRFQAMLHGGDPVEAAVATTPLAKSGMPPEDRLAWRRAQRDSGLPRGARHEAWSVALVGAYLASRADPYPGDQDLLLHLIASHHGHARPFLPLVIDQDPRPVEATVYGVIVAVSSGDTVDLEHPARFGRLNARYGRWGLALLEAIVRCADMTVSSEGS